MGRQPVHRISISPETGPRSLNQVAAGDQGDEHHCIPFGVTLALLPPVSELTLNRQFLSSVLALAAMLPVIVSAATEIPAVVVSAARTEQSTLTTPASITVITRDQIEASGARHINEVLRGQGGVQINDLYGDGSRATVDMRGFGDSAGSNTLVLVDGRRLNNPDIAAPDLNSIALDDVERIEIVQGSAGVLFGDQAVGGVINVITRKPGALRHSLKLSVGSYNTVQLHAMTSQALSNGVNYLLSVDARESDNYRDHNEASYINGLGRLGYEYDTGSVFAELQYINDEINTPGTLFADEVKADRRQSSPRFADDFSNAKTAIARLGIDQLLSDNWSVEAELTGRDTNGEFILTSIPGTQDRRIFELTPRLIGFVPAANNTMMTLGADLVASDYRLSTGFGDQLNDQSQHSLYAQAVIPASQVLDVTLGVRYAEVQNDLRDTGTFAIYPNGVQIDDDVTVGTVGLAIKADENWRVVFRVDQNYRFAKVDEYLQPVFTQSSMPVVLKTQQGLSIETGVEWASGGNTAKLLVYQLDLDDEIAFDPDLFLGGNINLDETRRKGVITSGYWQKSNKLGYSVSYTYTDAEVLSGQFAGKDIPLVARHSLLLGSDYQLSEKWQLYGELFAISDRVFGGDFNNVLGRLPGYGLINIKAGYDYRDFTFTARVNNLLNKEYSDVGESTLVCDEVTFVCTPTEAFFTSPEINFMLTAAWQFR